MNVYVACGLTHVPREEFAKHVQFVHDIARAISAVDGVHRVKYALVDSDPQLAGKPREDRARLCYLWDRTMVEEANLVVAEASYPSTGMGIELQIAEFRNIPVILLHSASAVNRATTASYATPDSRIHELQIGEGYVTLMVLGLPNLVKIIRYDNPDLGIRALFDEVHLLLLPSV